MGNCMLCAQIGVEPEFDQSAAYVEGWLEAMKEIEISRLLSFGKLCCNVRSSRQ
ncbi:zincin-like metallopeptidase domain-containing protein [Sulfitobacter faviae]|uniref:zincin-like metallopeptidase domain-containing protein n=1 Tax=Sulfitobacter faviae TaxID=1775881 RepID=UPI003CCEBAB0